MKKLKRIFIIFYILPIFLFLWVAVGIDGRAKGIGNIENNAENNWNENNIYTAEFIVSDGRGNFDIYIQYPQIKLEQKNSNDVELENRINQTIFSYAVAAKYIEARWTSLKVQVSYEITCVNDNLLSMVFHIISDYPKKEENFYAITIDINTGELLKLSELIDEDVLISFFNSKLLKQKEWHVILQNQDINSIDEISEKLTQQFILSKDEYNDRHNYYIKENEIVGFFISMDDNIDNKQGGIKAIELPIKINSMLRIELGKTAINLLSKLNYYQL